MAGTLIICEKANQAREVSAIIQDRYGRVLAASGHLLRLQVPDEIEPRWGTPWSVWQAEAMLPADGIYGYALPSGTTPDDVRRTRLYQDIAAALKTATTVIVATDPDREGQAIGDEILVHAGYKGRVLRALYNNNDRETIEKAFADLRDNAGFQSQYHSALARQNVDQIFGFSLTRQVTKEFRRLGWSGRVLRGKRTSKIGIGRVRSPVWGLICSRELEIDGFQPRDYFEVSLEVAGDAGRAVLWHRPGAESRIHDRAIADALAAQAKGYSGPIAVKSEAKKTAPPRPPDLPVLQKRASALWGWKATRTLEVLQALYNDHGLVSYPRAETRYVPEVMIADAPALLAGLRTLAPFTRYELAAPVIRTGKAGTFCDAALAKSSHYAIIPNIAKAAGFAQAHAKLGEDERKLFDLVAAFYLSAIGAAHEYERTELGVSVGETLFSTVGIVVRKPGWKAAFGKDGFEGDAADGQDQASLPPFRNADQVAAAGSGVAAKITKPPARYTDGSIVDAMQNIWRYVADEEMRQRLKATNGLGTPATRDTFITELEKDALIVTGKKGQLQPTEDGLKLYRVLVDCCSALFDPASTARLEIRLDDVLHERAALLDVIAEGAAITQARITEIEAWASTKDILFHNPPTAPMIEKARKVAAELGVALPDDALANYGLCRAWLDKNVGSNPSGPQLKFAQEMAERLGETLPEEVAAERGKLSAWIDKAKPRSDALQRSRMSAEPASEKQVALIARAIQEGKAVAPEGWPSLDKLTASRMIDALMKPAARKAAKPATREGRSKTFSLMKPIDPAKPFNLLGGQRTSRKAK